MNNPSLVPNLPFVNDVWPGYKNSYFPGSASANYFYSVYGVFGSSFLDSLHAARSHLGRVHPGKCLEQSRMLHVFRPARQHHADVDERRRSRFPRHHGRLPAALLQWPLSSISTTPGRTPSTMARRPKPAPAEQAPSIQDIYNLSAFRGSSDFDIRHNFNANFMYALPFGQGQAAVA